MICNDSAFCIGQAASEQVEAQRHAEACDGKKYGDDPIFHNLLA
jgi:hypothetical protein